LHEIIEQGQATTPPSHRSEKKANDMGNLSNYPPGCTSAHVEAAFGGDDDGPCGAQSPDGLY